MRELSASLKTSHVRGEACGGGLLLPCGTLATHSSTSAGFSRGDLPSHVQVAACRLAEDELFHGHLERYPVVRRTRGKPARPTSNAGGVRWRAMATRLPFRYWHLSIPFSEPHYRNNSARPTCLSSCCFDGPGSFRGIRVGCNAARAALDLAPAVALGNRACGRPRKPAVA